MTYQKAGFAQTLTVEFPRFIKSFPARVRDPHFWAIQFIVLSVTALHYGLHAAEPARLSDFHDVPLTFYLIAVVYAGIHYNLEGGFLTALWVSIISVPSMFIWNHGSLGWLEQGAQLLATFAVGMIVAWRVKLESIERSRAEMNSHRLTVLHEISGAVSETLELERVLDTTLVKVASALDSDRGWISVWDEPTANPTLAASIGEGKLCGCSPHLLEDLWLTASREVQTTGRPAVISDLAISVPLMAHGKVLGALGVGCRANRAYTEDDIGLLGAMANQIAVAMDNSRLYRDELRMQEALRQYAGQVTRAQEEERKRIARELHDDVIQNLVLLCRHLDQSPLSSDAEQLHSLAFSSLQSIRRFSRDLRPSILDDLGLIPAIEWLTTDVYKRTGISATLKVKGESRRLSNDTELLLFRIVQESLRNVEKHSHATEVSVVVNFTDHQIGVSVSDDGRGFQLGPLKDGVYLGKLGLLGMQERANLLGASFDIHSKPGRGTSVKVSVRCEPETSSEEAGPRRPDLN